MTTEGLIWRRGRRGLYRHLAARAVLGSRPARSRVFLLLLFLAYFSFFFSCFFRGYGRPPLPHRDTVPGGVPVDGIRVAGAPPSVPAEG